MRKAKGKTRKTSEGGRLRDFGWINFNFQEITPLKRHLSPIVQLEGATDSQPPPIPSSSLASSQDGLELAVNQPTHFDQNVGVGLKTWFSLIGLIVAFWTRTAIGKRSARDDKAKPERSRLQGRYVHFPYLPHAPPANAIAC